MTTAKWTSKWIPIQERSRIYTILLPDLMERGVCQCGVEMLLPCRSKGEHSMPKVSHVMRNNSSRYILFSKLECVPGFHLCKNNLVGCWYSIPNVQIMGDHSVLNNSGLNKTTEVTSHNFACSSQYCKPNSLHIIVHLRLKLGVIIMDYDW